MKTKNFSEYLQVGCDKHQRQLAKQPPKQMQPTGNKSALLKKQCKCVQSQVDLDEHTQPVLANNANLGNTVSCPAKTVAMVPAMQTAAPSKCNQQATKALCWKNNANVCKAKLPLTSTQPALADNANLGNSQLPHKNSCNGACNANSRRQAKNLSPSA